MAINVVTILLGFALVLVTLLGLTRLRPAPVPARSAETRARHAAAAGIQRGLEELQRAAEQPWQAREYWTYHGEDADADGELDPGEDTDANGRLDGATVPLDDALRPSLAVMRDTRPDTVRVDGRERGASGYLRGMRQPRGDQYVLRILDSSSRIWLNGPRERTWRMLASLARRLGLEATVPAKIMLGRPKNGTWRTEEDLIPLIGVPAYRALLPYVTAHAWTDPRTLAVCPPEDRVRPLRPGDPVHALGDLRPLELHPTADEIASDPSVRRGRPPSDGKESPVVLRAPVNLNTASPEVLAAVMEGVQGQYVDERAAARHGASGWGVGYEWMDRTLSFSSPEAALGVLAVSPPVTAAQADALADAIVRLRPRRPFRTWDDVRDFLDARVREGAIEPAQAHALLANADPNARLNDFNPDAAAWTPIDKTDLLAEGATTEFCFSSMGWFTIESLGRVLDADGRVLARANLKVHVRAYEVWRDTVEADFLAPVAAGGHPATQIEAYAGEGLTREGLALEPLPEPATPAGVARAWYDGRIGLATLAIPPGRHTWLRATFSGEGDQALDADDWRVRAPAPDPADAAARERWDAQVRRARAARSEGLPVSSALISGRVASTDRPSSPGNVFRDGVFLERDSALRFRAEDNLPFDPSRENQTRRGSVSFWLKPSFDPLRTPRPRTLWSVDRNSPFTAGNTVGWSPFGAYLFPAGPDGAVSDGPYSYGFPLEGLLGFGLGFKSAFEPSRALPDLVRELELAGEEPDEDVESALRRFESDADPTAANTLLAHPAEAARALARRLRRTPADRRLEDLGRRLLEALPRRPERDWVAAGLATGRREFAQLRPHAWVHVAFAWDLDRPASRAFRMAVNGRPVPAGNAFEQIAGSLPLRGLIDFAHHGGEAPLVGPDPESARPDTSTWIAFGALGADGRRNLPLDSTIDEIRVGEFGAFEEALLDAADGRYARPDSGAGESRTGAAFTSGTRRPPEAAVPGSISWTVRSAASLPDSLIRLSFWDGQRWRGPYEDPGGATLAEPGDAATDAEFRYRAVFTTGARRGTPVMETPYLEDVTVTYMMKPAIVAWGTPP